MTSELEWLLLFFAVPSLETQTMLLRCDVGDSAEFMESVYMIWISDLGIASQYGHYNDLYMANTPHVWNQVMVNHNLGGKYYRLACMENFFQTPHMLVEIFGVVQTPLAELLGIDIETH